MKNLLTLLALFLPFLMMAQDLQRNCSTMEHLEMQKAQDPLLEEKMNEIENQTATYVRNFTDANRAVTTIPVVIHVLYRTSAENISDAQIQSQIDVLNEDFRRTNSDRTNKWSQAADSEIEFCLEQTIRKSTKKRSWGSDDSVKKDSRGGSDPYSPETHLNMWVCNLGSGLLGYAQFPGGSPSTDGVVCLYNAFGRVGTLNSTYNLGRTTTHEVGHYLNLRHIWGDGGCSVDDFVGDTPTSGQANYSCSSTITSCGSEDMIENYMDYTNDVCMNLFTAGQKARMQACLSGPRAGLGTVACGGSTGATCSDGVQNGNETGVDCGGSCAPCAPTGACDAPSNLYSTSRKGGKGARLSWNGVNAAASYNIRYRQTGGSWSNTSSSSTQKDINVTKNASYEWEVQSVCTGEVSGWSAGTFTGGTSGKFTADFGFTMFPNPARNTVELDLNGDITAAQMTIHDMLGRTVQTQIINQYNTIDISKLDKGVYLVRIVTADGQSTVQKLMKTN